MLSKYYKEQKVKKIAGHVDITVDLGGGMKFNNQFYNLSSFKATLDAKRTIVTDNDIIHAGVLWQNSLVVGMRNSWHAGMHPLSRVAASEQNLDKMADYLATSSKMKSFPFAKDKNTAVKLFNTACTRKPHQFQGETMYYVPELAAACLIVNVMTSPKVSPGLLTIANSALKKIAKTAGAIDPELVMDMMDFTLATVR